jgi:hypothetical protein
MMFIALIQVSFQSTTSSNSEKKGSSRISEG